METRLLAALVLLLAGPAIAHEDNRLQQELDMGSPSNLAATAVAAALEGEDDFNFGLGLPQSEEEPLPSPLSSAESSDEALSAWPTSNSARVQRLWGIPDTSATIGSLFTFSIPADAFSGEPDTYEVSGLQGEKLPRWVLFKPAIGQFEGVPGPGDLGETYVKVQARGVQGDLARDVFAINVVPRDAARAAKVAACEAGQDRLLVTVLVDVPLREIAPRKKVAAVRNLAGFLAIQAESVELDSQDAENGVSLHDSSVVAAGAGNVKRPRTALDPATVLRFPSSCAVPGHPILTERLQALAKDGTLAEVLQLPVIGWLAQSSEEKPKTPAREKRQVEGSGSEYDYDPEGDEEDDEEEEDDDDGATPDAREIPTMASPTFPEPTATTPQMQSAQHPHRHHHGQDEEDTSSSRAPSASPALYASILPTPVLVPLRPTRVLSSDVISSVVFEPSFEPSRVGYEDYAPAPTPSVTPGLTSTTEEDYEEEDGLQPSTVSRQPSTSHVTEPLPPSSSSTPLPPPESTTGALEPPPSSTERPSTSRQDLIEIDVKNFAPRINHRLQKVPVSAGKALRFVIPDNTFSDMEDGGTRNLRLIFKSAQGTALPPSSWIQFNPETQEVYALPVEEQVSKWTFEVEAMDKEGKTASDSLELVVQHHKGWRTVNHEFTLQLKIEQKFDFPSSVDWQLNVLNGLTRFFGDSDESQITVINATSSMSSVDKVFFTWTNDSLPRHECANATLKQMYDAMTINERGEPSMALKGALGEAFKVKQVLFRGLSQCENVFMGPLPPGVLPKGRAEGPAVPAPDANNPLQNFAPVLRNQVDHLNATVGQLLVFRVPEDSFYDPEDGSTRNMKLTLLTMNRLPVDSDHWLQFDVKNQEFYGVPSDKDRGLKEYQLVCEDSGGLTANDGLVVAVQPAPALPYNVEFRMTLANPSLDSLEDSAATKRRLMERLGQLFGDPDARNLVLAGLRPPPHQFVKAGDPTPAVEVSWYNKTLPREVCPEQEVGALRRMLVSEDAHMSGNAALPVASLGGRVREIMKEEFPVLRVAMVPTGLCQGELTFVHAPVPPEPPSDDDLATFGSSESSDEYLITYIVPAVVIAAMLLLAGLVACVLYRRRRRGKLAVGESGPGAAGFRTRGIPVIFQDELDEKAVEPVAKSPVIMKNEKPPLPPPEYPQHNPSGMTPHATPPMHPHRHPTAEDPLLSEEPEASPYQPPPPFTSNRDTGRQNRPKPTPTYRKPPPYVPP